MRGAKAKALRRLSRNSGLPPVTYDIIERRVTVMNENTGLPVTFMEPQLVLGKSQRSMTKFAKIKLAKVPIVGMVRAARRQQQAVLDGNKFMEIIPISDPTTEAA